MTEPFVSHLLIAAPQNVAEKLRDILAAAKIAPSEVCYTGEAALRAAQEDTLLLTTWRLSDMTGMELARKMGDSADVLMIVPQDCQEEPEHNVMLLRNPISQEALIQSVRVLRHCGERMHALRERAQNLTRMLEERKIVERAKGHLMDTMHLSESDAHYRMQKMSMDTGRRIVDVARAILADEENVAC